MPIIGTAGHVDHGKSTLVLRLTGRDPDRFAEEKRRGLTIDLGFAWMEVEPGVEVGFVDVPGHQRFIKNMLAGTAHLDVGLFVVAADEGWMPQSEEHMCVLEMLAVRSGVIAMSRIDLVDRELREVAATDIADHVAGTALAGWPIVPVSAVTGEGIDDVRAGLRAAIALAGPPPDHARPRLWIDRSFVVHGSGVVVTGTLFDGTIRQGDELELLPERARARVRSIQSHERRLDEIGPGSRTALNLAGVDSSTITRGMVLVSPGTLRTSTRFLADVETARWLRGALPARGAHHVHLGAGSWPCRLRVLDEGVAGSAASVLIQTVSEVPMTMGDRFTLRDTGRQAVVGGGVVLDPRPRRAIRETVPRLRTVVAGTPDERAALLLEVRGEEVLGALAADSGGGSPGDAIVGDGVAVSRRRTEQLAADALEAVLEYQATHPLRPGIPRSSLASSLGVRQPVLEAVLGHASDLAVDGAVVRTRDFTPTFPESDPNWLAVQQILARSLAVPRAGELGIDEELIHAAVRTGRLVRITDDLVYLPEQIVDIEARLGGLPAEFTVGRFRDELDITRRQAVPLLGWLDARGWTTRRGDLRSLRSGRS